MYSKHGAPHLPCIASAHALAPLLVLNVITTQPKYPGASGVATLMTVPNLTHSISMSAWSKKKEEKREWVGGGPY